MVIDPETDEGARVSRAEGGKQPEEGGWGKEGEARTFEKGKGVGRVGLAGLNWRRVDLEAELLEEERKESE